MKDDVGPLPDTVPKKRRAIEQLADLHVALWLAGDDITPLERKKLTAEKERRKTLRPPVKVGLLVPQEGLTPLQFKAFQEALPSMGATEVHFPELPSKVYYVVKQVAGAERHKYGVALGYADALAKVVRESTVVLAFPKGAEAKDAVNANIKYAKHRSIPVRVIGPGGH